ncbi:MAG TPA: beta-propeller domain-containing protein, partial [Anaeromyxobacteraceae bacterium]|nr:beta-propeller domain-containing protein [Anaeromyxobacteraceae bacterium]
VAGSQLWAVDVTRPDAPAVLSRLDVAGSVQETRLVGDVLYVVSRKWSWQDVLPTPGGLPVASGGSTGDLAYVASFDVADPRSPRAVARVELPATGWDAHAHVTAERIALAQSGFGPSGETTRFTFVDVSDPAGALRTGASFEVAGRIADRWGLDQDGGVFRAVLQNGWNGGATLRTWASASVDEATPLGRLDIVIPETLTAARFDGARVYAVTAERVDPLWVVDASDPARPVLAGQLHMPGQIEFVEPRGDRLLALGHTNEGGQPWQLAVSLVDVADPAVPALRARVLVGGGSGGVGATQDDLRKAFRILDAEGLALVPWQGWDPATWRWTGGVQLVDFDLAAGTLALRALVPHAGAVSRAFPVPGRAGWIAALSDERLQVIDAADRDAPVERASLDLARSVNAIAFFGGSAVELCGDWWRGDGALVVVPASDPDAAVPLARLELAAPQARLFRVGEVAWLLSHDFTQGKAWLEAVDLSDPLRPVRRGRLELDPAEAPGWSGGGWLGTGDEAALSGNVLAVHRSWYGPVATGLPAFAPGGGPWAAEDAVALFDLSDPDAPRRAARVVLPASGWSWGLRAEAGLLWVTHHEWTSDARDRVRFYLDRIDATDPDRPRLLPKVNVPGAFLGAASPTRIHTLETRWDDASGVASSRVHALDLTERGTARLAGTVSLPGWLTGAVTGAGHAWAVTQEWGGSGSSTRLAAIDLGAMRLESTQRLDVSWAWPVAATGGKLFVAASTQAGSSLLVLGLDAPGAPRLERSAPTQGFAWDVVVEAGVAYVPGGAWGVTVVPLSP